MFRQRRLAKGTLRPFFEENGGSEYAQQNAVAIWPVTGQGFQNTKWPAVLYSQ